MYIVENYGLAVALCLVTMLCWGSWGNTQKLAAKTWRYELFYWDYVVGILLFSLIWGFTLGSGQKCFHDQCSLRLHSQSLIENTVFIFPDQVFEIAGIK